MRRPASSPRRPREGGKVTIKEVAAHAGVSAMTVSNVFNDTGKFSRETRERVLAAINALGYVPNSAARRLVGATPARIGLLYAGVDSMFIDAVLAAAAVASAERGLQLMARKAASAGEALDAARALQRSGADALLLLPPFDTVLSGSAAFRALGLAAASIATAAPLPDMFTVRIDNRAASRAMTERLIARGRRRIAIIAGPQDHSDSVERLLGCREALEAHGLDLAEDRVIEGRFTFESGLAAAERLLALAELPDAIVAANDDMAAAALWVAHRRGLSLPRDLAVTGFDDTLLATRVWPPLTTVRQPIDRMTARALDLLLDALRRRTDEPADVLEDYALVGRASD
ncbi:LacI family transcriptional regulator [Caulobacter sp. D5]|uniref:LacI family DNA-binding transcriptional regulator n=3 Tax=unclassified Caulobacter TaxID=2648921 RepID=UPI000D73FBFA|nr:LacI family DNA-binding transcriptional regulator [Caulobacter sp. D5]PXA91409.1 LacI family transcriptional regulator [Caulobacter sp. D5]